MSQADTSKDKSIDASLRQASDYLQRNAALRRAVGASAGAKLEPHVLGVGEHNLNYWFTVPETGLKYVLRINVASQPFHEDQVAYEFSALKALVDSRCAPLPVYLDNTLDTLEKGVLVISFCEGSVLDFDRLRPGDLRCAAQLMADIHSVRVQDDCKVFRPADPLRELFDECRQRFEVYRSSAFEERRLTRWIEAFMAAAEPMTHTECLEGDCSHIVNTETLPSHFLIPEQSARCAAEAQGSRGRFCENPGSFVDWERPIIGEVAQDVAYFVSPTTTYWDSEYLFPADAVDAFLNDYWRAVDGRFEQGNFEQRFKAFRMMTALRSATWCCRALIQYGAGGARHTTEKTARKLPIYLSDDFMHMVSKECFGL